MHWAEKSEKPPSFLQKTENQRLNWRNPKPAQVTKTAKTEKPNQTLAKDPKAPLFQDWCFCKLKNNVDTFNSMNLVGSLVWKFSWLNAET